jgi:ubiquinone/menaquinone biosynthesis C-methylase UbiE
MIGHDSRTIEADATTRGRLIRWARFYDPMVALCTLGRASALREQAVDLAGIRTGESVLEVGCGTGSLTQRAAARTGPTGQVCGIDPSAEMIAVAREKAARAGLTIDYRVAAIEALPYPNASFDVVLSSLMMHHLPDDLKALGLAELRRVLRPVGRLFILDMKRPRGFLSHLALMTIGHVHLERGVEDLASLIEAAGFGDIRNGETRLHSIGYVSARVSA